MIGFATTQDLYVGVLVTAVPILALVVAQYARGILTRLTWAALRAIAPKWMYGRKRARDPGEYDAESRVFGRIAGYSNDFDRTSDLDLPEQAILVAKMHKNMLGALEQLQSSLARSRGREVELERRLGSVRERVNHALTGNISDDERMRRIWAIAEVL